jgi:hypothetical protein
MADGILEITEFANQAAALSVLYSARLPKPASTPLRGIVT